MSAFTEGDPAEGRKIVERIWARAKKRSPKIYTPQEISESTERVVEEVFHNGLGYYVYKT